MVCLIPKGQSWFPGSGKVIWTSCPSGTASVTIHRSVQPSLVLTISKLNLLGFPLNPVPVTFWTILHQICVVFKRVFMCWKKCCSYLEGTWKGRYIVGQWAGDGPFLDHDLHEIINKVKNENKQTNRWTYGGSCQSLPQLQSTAWIRRRDY